MNATAVILFRIDASKRIKMSLKVVLHYWFYKQQHIFLANIDLRLLRSRVYMFLNWYVYSTFEKYNSN